MKIMTLLLINFIFCQGAYDVLRPYFGYSNAQISVSSIGNATVASGFAIDGATSNPANLATHRYSSIQGSLSNKKFISGSNSLTQTGFNGIHAIMPISVYRGSLVFSGGVEKEIDYLSTFEDNTFLYSEEGGLYSWNIGMAVEFAQKIFIGAKIKYYNGSDDMTEFGDGVTYNYNPEYRGFGMSVGMLHSISKYAQYGLSIDLPTTLSVADNFTYSNLDNINESYSDTWHYRAKKPLVLHGGFGVFINNISLFYELEWTDWKNLEFSSSEIYEEDLELPASVFINQDINTLFKTTISHHFGSSMRVPLTPIKLSIGYEYLPVPFSGVYDLDIRESFSSGISIPIQKNITLEGSYVNYYWDYMGAEESYDKFSFGISLRY